MAGETRLTRMLLGMGLRNFSMHPAHILTIKQRVLTSDVGEIRPIVDRMRRTDDPARLAHMLERLNG
jgi:phosphotransferase system enzyme I (PtsI)